MQAFISVIIPTYNRARILERTIPTYLQEYVGEIILVDDASIDHTAAAVEALQRQYKSIRYIRLPENRKQQGAKNEGIRHVSYPYIYFGDDDSILLPGTMTALYETLQRYKADIVGARALYMDTKSDLENMERFLSRHQCVADGAAMLVDLHTLETNFSLLVDKPLELPFVHACSLVRSQVARDVLFDESYRGNAYREETDFFLSASKRGAKIYYDSRGVQINLPREIVGSPANARKKLKIYYYMVLNTWKLLNKHHAFLQEKYHLSNGKYEMQLNFTRRQLWKGLCNFLRKR